MCALLTALALAARRSPSLSVASQLVGRIDGNARGILAPAVFSKRMLGTTRGSTDRQEHRGAAKEGALASAESAAPDAAAADGTPNLGLVDRHDCGGCIYVPELGCALVCWVDGALDVLEVVRAAA